MRIQNPNSIFVPRAYTQVESVRSSQAIPVENVGKAGKSDSVTLSNTTLQLQKISAAMDASQEDRANKISALKESIAQGNYNIQPEKIAEKFMQSFFI